MRLISGPSCLLWDFIQPVTPFPIFSSFSSLLAPRMYAQAPAFYLLDLTKSLFQLFLLFWGVWYLSRIACICYVTDSKLCQSCQLQLQLFSGILLHSPDSRPHLLSPGPPWVFINSSPYPQSFFPFLLYVSHCYSDILKCSYHHITPLSLKPTEAQHCPSGTNSNSIEGYLRALMIWPLALWSHVLLVYSWVPPVVAKAVCFFTVESFIFWVLQWNNFLLYC